MRKDEFPLIDAYADSKVNEVLDKIRAEIEQLREDYKAYWEMEEANALDNALTIIDKYKAESEGKDGR